MFDTPQEVFYSVIGGVLLMIALTSVFILSVIRYQRRLYIHRKEKQDLASQYSELLLKSQLEIKDQTLKDIGYELHDNLGQLCSLIKIHLNTLDLNNPNSASEKIADTKALVRQLISDLKSLSLSLNSDRIANFGILEGIKIEIEKVKKFEKPEVEFHHFGPEPYLEPNRSVIIYRMIQEIINNILKHSKAKHLNLSLHVKEKSINLEFRDDGIGFDLQEKLRSGGSGLVNLMNRAKLIQGELKIDSSEGNGTNYYLAIPQ